MLAFVKTKAGEYDLDNEDTKSSLRQKVKDNQAKTLEMVVAAVKSGSTLQQARVGMSVRRVSLILPLTCDRKPLIYSCVIKYAALAS
jgi:hypothetical protein